MARELCNRWREQINTTPLIGQSRYDVMRAIADGVAIEPMPPKLLAA